MALVGQKFITDVATDAMHYHRLRQNAPVKPPPTTSTTQPPANMKKKPTTNSTGTAVPGVSASGVGMTVEDLQAALSDRGISIKRPPYYT